jgi:hypothetical protein
MYSLPPFVSIDAPDEDPTSFQSVSDQLDSMCLAMTKEYKQQARSINIDQTPPCYVGGKEVFRVCVFYNSVDADVIRDVVEPALSASLPDYVVIALVDRQKHADEWLLFDPKSGAMQ